MTDTDRFLGALDPGGPFTFQTFDDDEARKSVTLARVLHGSHAQHARALAHLNAQGAGVFVMVNAGDCKGRKSDNVQRVRALFVDIDTGGAGALTNALSVAKQAGAPPHLVVESSPGKYHVYWRVSDCPLPRFGGLQAALAQRFGGDPKVKDLPRVMRLPGYQHRKGTPFETRLLHASEAPAYAIADLECALGLATVGSQPLTGATQSEWSVGSDARAALVGVAEGGRNDAIFRYACSLRARGIDEPEARVLVLAAAAGCAPPLPEGEALACLASAWRYDAPPAQNDDIARLAQLPVLEYEKQRKGEAERLGMRVSVLDEMVEAARPKTDEEETIPCPIPDVEPAAEPQNGAALLDDIAARFRRHVILPLHAAETLALWVLFTWCIDHVRVAPVLAITSPEKRCGKTTVLGLLTGLCKRPLPSANITAPVLFRAVEAWQPTLLIDEADTFLRNSDELRGVLNSGHTRSTAYVLRTVGDDHIPARFSTWGAKAIALIGKLPDTLHDRAIEVRLKRRLPDETVEKLRGAAADDDASRLAARCARWALDHARTLAGADPQIPTTLHDRAADNWEPLLAIADRAGGPWPSRAREAAIHAAGNAADDDSYRIMLLEDIRAVFDQKGRDRLTTGELTLDLGQMDDRPWCDIERGKPITPRRLARMLGAFGIGPGTIKLPNEKTLKGYKRESFIDAWTRYLPGKAEIIQFPAVGKNNSDFGGSICSP